MASLAEPKGKTRSMTGLMVPASARAAIARSCSPLAFMNRNEYRTWRRRARSLVRALSSTVARRTTGLAPICLAKAGSGGPARPMAMPPGLSTRRDFSSVCPPRLSRDHVVAAHDGLEVLAFGVDDHVGAEVLDPSGVGRARGRRDVRAEVLSELDRDRPDTTGPGVDEDLLAGAQVRPL